MNKKLIVVLCIAVLVLSFASARVINFQLGPSFSYFNGETPIIENPYETSPYKGAAFGIDTAIDLTFGPRAEVYLQETVNFSGKSAFTKDSEGQKVYDTFTLDYKAHAGFEFAVITDPVKLSVGGGFALEVVSTALQLKANPNIALVIVNLNVGLGATVKAEFPLANHWSAYVRSNIDYFPYAGFSMGGKDSSDPYSVAGKVKNFGIDVAAGIVLYF